MNNYQLKKVIQTMDIIKNYQPKNQQEAMDKQAMLEFLAHNPDAFDRRNLVAHFTSSAIIINKKMDKVLFIHHLIYKSWGWVGGHNDGDKDFLKVALKEAKEETGLKRLKPLLEAPVALDNIYVENHIKNGIYVGDHIHMNLTFLMVGHEDDPLSIKVDENSGVQWFLMDDALNHISEPRMRPIYQKIFNIVKSMKA